MVIDIHTHSFPDKIAGTAIGNLKKASHTVSFTDGTMKGLKASMEEGGIDLSVVLPVATAERQVIHINDASARANEVWEERGIFSAGAMHPCFDGWKDELARIRDLGLKGIKVHPVYQDVDLNDIRFLRIFDRCAELGLFVVTHAGLDIGFPGVVRCSPKMAADVLSKVSGLKIVLAHMGGWKNWQEVPEMLAGTNAYLDTAFSTERFYPQDDGYWSAEDAAMLDRDEFMKIVSAFGSHRILFGSDCPWSRQGEVKSFIESLPLDETDREMILGKNAEELILNRYIN